jgi:hypothetical protein
VTGRRPNPTNALTEPQRDVRDQQRPQHDETTRGYVGAALPVGPGRILLQTSHYPTEVRLDDIATVHKMPENSLQLRGLVVMHDGTRYHVPNPAEVVNALYDARRGRRGRS